MKTLGGKPLERFVFLLRNCDTKGGVKSNWMCLPSKIRNSDFLRNDIRKSRIIIGDTVKFYFSTPFLEVMNLMRMTEVELCG